MMDQTKYAGNLCIFGGPYIGYQDKDGKIISLNEVIKDHDGIS